MLDPEFVKYLASLGVGGVIAILIYYSSRKELTLAQKVYEERLVFFAEQWKGQADALIQVVKENSVAITANTQTVLALHRRMDDERSAVLALRQELAPVLKDAGIVHKRRTD